LHDCQRVQSHGAAKDEEMILSLASTKATPNDEVHDLTTRKVTSDSNRVILLCTTAVKVVNPITGKLTLAYAQLDTASQASTLISNNLKAELRLETTPDPTVALRTLSDQKVSLGGRTNITLQSLYNGENYAIKDALVVSRFSDDASTLPHALDTSTLKHFDGVHIPHQYV